MKGCMPSTIKYLLIGVNFVVLVFLTLIFIDTKLFSLCFQLTGLVVLGFSVYGMVDTSGFEKLVAEGAEALGEDITVNLVS